MTTHSTVCEIILHLRYRIVSVETSPVDLRWMCCFEYAATCTRRLSSSPNRLPLPVAVLPASLPEVCWHCYRVILRSYFCWHAGHASVPWGHSVFVSCSPLHTRTEAIVSYKLSVSFWILSYMYWCFLPRSSSSLTLLWKIATKQALRMQAVFMSVASFQSRAARTDGILFCQTWRQPSKEILKANPASGLCQLSESIQHTHSMHSHTHGLTQGRPSSLHTNVCSHGLQTIANAFQAKEKKERKGNNSKIERKSFGWWRRVTVSKFWTQHEGAGSNKRRKEKVNRKRADGERAKLEIENADKNSLRIDCITMSNMKAYVLEGVVCERGEEGWKTICVATWPAMRNDY